MSDPTDAVPRGITDDPAESIEDARRHLDFLEEGMHALADTPDAPALLDEAYRAAHSLKSEFTEAEMPQAARIARLVQECVQAVRAGRLRASADLGALLISAARAARDALNARVAGRKEPGSAAAAASALEHLLARPAASLTGAEGSSHEPFKLSHVDERQLRAAIAASQTAVSAAASFARTCGDADGLLASFRDMARRQDKASRELLDAIPKALAEAATGVPATAIAGDFAERIAALGATAVDFEDSLSRFTGKVRDAATTGARAAAASGVILSRIGTVRLDSVFADFPRTISYHARKLSENITAKVEVGDAVVDAGQASRVNAAVRRCAGAALVPGQKGSGTGGKGSAGREVRLTVTARLDETSLIISLVHEGKALRLKGLSRSLAAMSSRLLRSGVTMEIESGKEGRVIFSLRLARPAASASMADSYMVATAAEILYAIPIAVIQECITVPVSAKYHNWRTEEVPVVRVSESRAATAGIVVLAGEGKAVLVFDTVEGEDSLMQAPAGCADALGPGITAAAARANGGVALVLDVDSYISALRRQKKNRKSRPPKKKP